VLPRSVASLAARCRRLVPGLRPQDLRRLWFRGLAFAGVYRRLILRERPLSEPIPDLPARVTIRVRLLAESDVAAYLAFRSDQDAADIRRRLDAGHCCFAVWHDGQIIAAGWAVTGRASIPYLSAEIALAPGDVYCYDAFTATAFRGLDVSPSRNTETMRYLRDRGYRRLVAALLPDDRSALRPGEKVGWDRRIGVVGAIGLGPWRRPFCRVTDGAPRLAVTRAPNRP